MQLSEVVAAYVTQQAANGRSVHTQLQIARSRSATPTPAGS